MNAIEVADVHKVYRSKAGTDAHALNGVSFKVPEGMIYGLLGPNGAGKSTMVRILSTITSPTSGHATILGCDVVRQGLAARGKMAVVLQHTASENLLTVSDNLMIYAYLHGVGPAKRSIVPQGSDRALRAPTSLVVDAHKAGLLVHPYTFRDEPDFLAPDYRLDPVKEYLQFYLLGVDAVFSDFSDTAVRARNLLHP